MQPDPAVSYGFHQYQTVIWDFPYLAGTQHNVGGNAGDGNPGDAGKDLDVLAACIL
jgi:hypothetical protein